MIVYLFLDFCCLHQRVILSKNRLLFHRHNHFSPLPGIMGNACRAKPSVSGTLVQRTANCGAPVAPDDRPSLKLGRTRKSKKFPQPGASSNPRRRTSTDCKSTCSTAVQRLRKAPVFLKGCVTAPCCCFLSSMKISRRRPKAVRFPAP